MIFFAEIQFNIIKIELFYLKITINKSEKILYLRLKN